jgi:DNA-binding beta-propeller fold protein YncE
MLALAFSLLLAGCQGGGPWGLVSTVAGERRGDVDGSGRAARFDNPTGVAVGADGTIYVADTYNHRIRAVDAAYHVTTLAGSGPAGLAGGGDQDGPGEAARFRFPRDLAVDGHGHLYVADTNNHRVRMIDLATHVVTTVAGSKRGLVDGPGKEARFDDPWGLAASPDGVVYVSDTYNHRIRRVDPRAPGCPVTTLAGCGPAGAGGGGYHDGLGAEAYFKGPRGLVADGDALYVADASNQAIRRVALSDPAHAVTTLGGTQTMASRLEDAAPLIYPTGLVVAAGHLYAVDSGTGTIYRVAPDGTRTWVVGGAKVGHADGFWRGGQFKLPAAIARDHAGHLLATDTGNHRLRLVL